MNSTEAKDFMEFLTAIFPQYQARKIRVNGDYGAEEYEVQIV